MLNVSLFSVIVNLVGKKSSGRRRSCLIWEIQQNRIEVLPIATFNARILTTTDNNSTSTVPNELLIEQILSIDSTPPLPNTRSLKPEIKQVMSKSLSDYLFLRSIFIL